MTDVIVTTEGDVQTWQLHRPRARNALSPALVESLATALTDAERDGARAVVLHGAGESFCAGADLAHLYQCVLVDESPRPFLSAICDLTVAMEQSPMIFVAALHGHAVAGGLELALACDVVVATPDTLIGDGHVKNNLVPGGGSSVRIVDRLGFGPGTWLALSGELVPASSLVASGWIRTLSSPERLLRDAQEAAAVLARVPVGAQTRFKRLLRGPVEPTVAALQHELDTFDAHWRTSDVGAHLRRFLRIDREETADV